LERSLQGDSVITAFTNRLHRLLFHIAIGALLGAGAGADARAPSVVAGSVQITQQGTKLVASDAVGKAIQGEAVSLSGDGNTAIVGGSWDNNGAGAAWIWIRSGGAWTQQGPKLVGSGAIGAARQGNSVSLSADATTAIVGGASDNNLAGGAWIWTRSSGVWTQQGAKLVGSDAVGSIVCQGNSVSLSADGNTAIIGGVFDNTNVGAAWIWTRSDGLWTQQGPKLVGSGAIGAAEQGVSVSLSADGNTAIVGGLSDDTEVGAAWVWTRSNGVWTQQGSKLVGSAAIRPADQGTSVSLSGDGNTAIVGGPYDNRDAGAAWLWIRSGGAWSQQGPKLVGSGAAGPSVFQGSSVSLSSDGNTAIIGGHADNGYVGAAWVWRRVGGVWTQRGNKLVGSDVDGVAWQGFSVSAASSATHTVIVGGFHDSQDTGAAWVYGPTPFTDDPLTPGVSVIKALHITELRARVDAVRIALGLGGFAWTDILSPGVTLIRAQHLVELRQALAEAYSAAGQAPPTYADPDLTIGTGIKHLHISELRAAVLALE